MLPRPTWSLLRRLAQARVVTSMYVWLLIVPLLARLLSKVSGEQTLRVFARDFIIDFGLPFTWQAFYFSALFITLGNIIYFLRCPNAIKDHATAHDFRAAGKGIDQLNAYAKDAGFPPSEYEEQKTIVTKHYNGDMNAVFHDLFWQVFDRADRHRLIALVIASMAYSLGLLLIAWVFGENLVAVVKAMP